MSLFSLVRAFVRPPLREEAAVIYSQLVTQARHPWFYTEAAVPDTLDGRFDLLVLHLFCYFQGGEVPNPQSPTPNPQPEALKLALLELMLDDMDQALREMGVGDMGVSRRIKQMGNAINGRLQAYEAALTANTFVEALTRNVYGTVKPEEISTQAVQKLSDYTRRLLTHV